MKHGFEHSGRACQRRPLFSDVAWLVIGVMALMVAVVTGIFAAGESVLPGDVWMATTVQKASGPVAEVLADVGNMVGATVWAAIAIGVAIVVAAVLRARSAVVFLATLLVLRLLGTQLKPLFESPRPTDDLVRILGVHEGSGYPSGHSLTGATMLLGLAVLAWRYMQSRRGAMVAVAVLVGLLLLVGWARVWVGAHWPSDVVGGFAFGIVFVAMAMVLTDRMVGRDSAS